jgi:TonB dependent receptor
MTLRSGNACHALAALLFVFGADVTSARAQDRALAGQVVDGRGAGLAGATIFVTQVGRARRAAEESAQLRATAASVDTADRVLRSGSDGSFSAQVPAGRYRIAVFKPGYEVALAEVNMATRNLLDVRMRPAAASPAEAPGDPAAREGGLDWILHRSDGDELRDIAAGLEGRTGSTALVSSRVAGTAPAALRWRMPTINGELRQDFSGSDLLGGETAGPGDASGRSTRLALRGPAGQQGSWRFDGQAVRTTAGLSGGDEARRGGATTGLGVGFDYRLGPDDDLKTLVRYSTRRYLFESLDAADDVDQAQRNSAVRARWDRNLGDGARLFVVGSCREAAFRQPDGVSTTVPTFTAGAMEGSGLVDRSVAAAAGVALRSADHAIDLGMRVHSFRYDLGDGGALLSGTDSSALPLEPGTVGRAMTLFGGDDWRITDRYALNYGLRYHDDLSSRGAYVVPRVGLTTTLAEAGDLIVRSAVMYRVEDGRPSPLAPGAPEPAAGRSDAGRLGYEIGVASRPEDRLQFAATLSYRPFQERLDEQDSALPSAGFPGEGVLVLSDATAGRHEMEIELERGFGLVRGVLLGSMGRVQGRLSPVLGDGPVVDPAEGQAHYYMTGLRATIKPTETEVRIDYRSVLGEADAHETGGAASLHYRRLDLAVLQDLPFTSFAASRFRVLMAYEGLLLDSVDGVAPWPGSGATTRVTGGVDISF